MKTNMTHVSGQTLLSTAAIELFSTQSQPGIFTISFSSTIAKPLWIITMQYAFSFILVALVVDGVLADDSTATKPFVDGYASELSVAPGERVSFHLSSNVGPIDLQIERLGAKRNRSGSEKVSLARLIPSQIKPHRTVANGRPP